MCYSLVRGTRPVGPISEVLHVGTEIERLQYRRMFDRSGHASAESMGARFDHRLFMDPWITYRRATVVRQIGDARECRGKNEHMMITGVRHRHLDQCTGHASLAQEDHRHASLFHAIAGTKKFCCCSTTSDRVLPLGCDVVPDLLAYHVQILSMPNRLVRLLLLRLDLDRTGFDRPEDSSVAESATSPARPHKASRSCSNDRYGVLKRSRLYRCCMTRCGNRAGSGGRLVIYFCHNICPMRGFPACAGSCITTHHLG